MGGIEKKHEDLMKHFVPGVTFLLFSACAIENANHRALVTSQKIKVNAKILSCVSEIFFRFENGGGVNTDEKGS